MADSMAPQARRGQTARRIFIELTVNVAAPFFAYSCCAKPLGDVRALLASSAPPIVWSIVEFLRNRRVDAVSLLVLAGIFLSLPAFVGGGSVRFLQLRENLVTALIGLVFLGSAAVGKPLIYQLARAGMARQSATKAAEFEALRSNERFRRSMTVMTLVWGFGLLLQTAAACALVFTLSISAYLIVGPIVGYAWLGALTLWTLWYVRRKRHRDAPSGAVH